MNLNNPNVGSRIRFLREHRRLSLRALAEKSGLSVNAIGMIERGENSPTVSSLHTLANALEVRIVDFFDEPRELATVFVKREQRLATRAGGLEMASLGYGIRNQQLEPFLVTLDSNEEACEEPDIQDDSPLGKAGCGVPVEHPGQEFVFCVDGDVTYEIAGVEYPLTAGDSLLFDATQPHRFGINGTAQAHLVVVFQAAEGTHIARERHLP